MRKISILVLFLAILSSRSIAVSPVAVDHASVHAHKVFESSDTQLSKSEVASLKALRGRKVRINKAWATAASSRPNDFGLNTIHQIELFSDVTITYVITDSSMQGEGRLVIFGKVAGQPESAVILAYNNGFLNGSILISGLDSYQIASGPGDLHTILKLDPSREIDCGVR